jgi:pyruvate dehydrogenase E2 component (dihydrolipoamide acetyltransferase)
MSDSKRETPHFYVQTEVAVDDLSAYLRDINEGDSSPRVTVTAVVGRAAVEALSVYRRFNSVWAGDVLIEADHVNLGVAIAVDGGLLAPAILSAETMTIGQLAAALRDLVGRTHAQRLRPEEISEGTFTLSNLGAFAVSAFAAIITPPQVATLAVARPVNRCVFVNGAAAPVSFMTVTLSADHRVVDGADAARWLEHFKASIEDPQTLFASSPMQFQSLTVKGEECDG